jgi:hypothetical protein
MGEPRWWRSGGGRWPACRTYDGGSTRWGVDPNRTKSARLGPRDLLLGGLAEGTAPGARCPPAQPH